MGLGVRRGPALYHDFLRSVEPSACSHSRKAIQYRYSHGRAQRLAAPGPGVRPSVGRNKESVYVAG
jgi:hypothetical protein